MRLGPFDLDASTSLDWIYASNIDAVPEKTETELSKHDHYLVWTLNLNLLGPSTPTSELNLSSSMSVEKHFIRDDLDNVSDPFGNVTLSHNFDLGRFGLPTTVSYVRENTAGQDSTTRIYIPGQRQSRIVQETFTFTQGVLWNYDPFSASFDYNQSQIRYDDEAFKDGEEDQQGWTARADWDVIQWGGEKRVNLFYSYARDQTDLINRPDGVGSGEWITDQAFGATFQILTRPNFTYTYGREKADEEPWRNTHTFDLSDQWELSPVMTLDANASYKIDEQPRDDDVAFVYSVGLLHDIDPTLSHTIRFTREPVDTFGSTTDTDSQTISYRIAKSQLFFANLTLSLGADWETNKPQEGPTEDITTYTANLAHSASLSKRLSRRFAYDFSHSKSSLDEEPIIEHTVTLGLTFNF
jgi:hypothetical protein